MRNSRRFGADHTVQLTCYFPPATSRLRKKGISAACSLSVGAQDVLFPHPARAAAGGICIALALAMALVITAVPARAQSGQKLYAEACESCHGPKGKGDGPAGLALKPHPANLSEVLSNKSDAWIAKVITMGGSAVGLPPTMPSFGASLSADDVKSLVEYVRQFGAHNK